MKLLLLDKDGSIVRTKSGKTFINDPNDQQPIEGVSQAIDHFVSDGWVPLIVSNQGGVAAGHKTLESTIEEMRFCLELFPQIQEAFFCPDFEGLTCWRVWGECDEQHRIQYENEIVLVPHGFDALSIEGYEGKVSPEKNFRKPNPGMIKLAIDLHAATNILFVGDREEDASAARSAGVGFMWASDWVTVWNLQREKQ